jgi:hypothetical protein
MNRKRTYFSIILLVFTHYLVTAQLRDGVTATQSFLDTIRLNYTAENAFKFDPEVIAVNVNIPIRVHIVRDIKGSVGVTLTEVKNGIITANSYFKNAGLQFFIDSVGYVDDYNYTYITFNKLRKELLTRYKSNNRINLFLVDSVKTGSFRSYGVTSFPIEADSNFIFLDKKYASGPSLTTMLGHFFGLLSTHETGAGMELADETNCSSSGDFICDTYADPGLYNNVIDSCKYIGTLRDNNGKYYVPSVANIMSDSPGKCRCIMTPLQYRRIYYYYRKYRQYLNY